MLRRRAMMQQAAIQTGPLYPMEDRDKKIISSISVKTTGNHVEWTTSANSRGPFLGRQASEATSSTSSAFSVWFHVNAGDTVDLWAKNLSYPATTDTPYSTITAKDTNGADVFKQDSFKRSADGTDLHTQKVIESSADVKGILFWNYRAITASCDLEIYVNGVRYV